MLEIKEIMSCFGESVSVLWIRAHCSQLLRSRDDSCWRPGNVRTSCALGSVGVRASVLPTAAAKHVEIGPEELVISFSCVPIPSKLLIWCPVTTVWWAPDFFWLCPFLLFFVYVGFVFLPCEFPASLFGLLILFSMFKHILSSIVTLSFLRVNNETTNARSSFFLFSTLTTYFSK